MSNLSSLKLMKKLNPLALKDLMRLAWPTYSSSSSSSKSENILSLSDDFKVEFPFLLLSSLLESSPLLLKELPSKGRDLRLKCDI